MKNSYLKTQIQILQNDYLSILKSVKDKLSTDDFLLIIDEIKLFWFSNRNLVELILENISSDYEAYVLTGGSFLDIDEFEHYPFVSLGEVHLVDDPLHNFGSIIHNIPDSAFAEGLKKQIILTVEDNIKILENYSDLIFIFPMRIINPANIEDSNELSKKAFLGLFKDEQLTMETYYEKYKTIKDVENNLLEHVKSLIVFPDENYKDDFVTRFNDFLASNPLPQDQYMNEALIFANRIIGFYMQGFNILFMCTRYQITPYLRYHIPFHYLNLLISSVPLHDEIKKLVFKCRCAHILYNYFDIDKVKDIDFLCYYNTLQKQNFSNNLFKMLEQDNSDLSEISVSTIKNLVEKEINKIYNYTFDKK